MASKIEWTDETWNPVTGCSPISAGCENCYAEMMSRRLKGRFGYPYQNPFQVTLHRQKFKVPLKWKSPRKVFISSMGDLFHPDVPDSWVDAVMCTTTKAPQHVYQILTKRPERMQTYFQRIVDSTEINAIPTNLWFGVTAENQQMADHRIPILINTPVNNRFVSVEPMLTPVDLTAYIDKLDWIITGGETGQKARYMDPDWAISIMKICKQHQVPFFFKQMSKKKPAPAELMIKEFPVKMP